MRSSARYLLLLLSLFGLRSVAWAQSVIPPQVLEEPAAIYPPNHQEEVTVLVQVTVDVEGAVTDPLVITGGGADFDQSALSAVKRWKFRPALRDGMPYASRIRIPFVFRPPPPPSAAPVTPPSVAKEEKPAPSDAGTPELQEVDVRGRPRPVNRGSSDFEIEVGKLAIVINQKASDILSLAPGIFIANEGGEGHADQVFLRGFNAEQGQSIEFTVNGVPINEVNNTDGHGYADTHFIIPEVVKNLRVIEGPFDPHQGDFAVAGSADYQLGLPQRGITLTGWYGSFQSKRLLAMYAPKDEREGTFAAAQFWDSAGFGSNRANRNASVMAQYEGALGARGLYRLLATAYATHYKSAGVLRTDDFRSGQVGFFDTYDPSQGGDAQRYSLSFDLENPTQNGVLKQQVFLTRRTLRIAENFTGFLLDDQLASQSLHPQRGDGIVQQYEALTLGARGGYRVHGEFLGREQSLEIGYYARYDHTVPQVERVRFGTQVPYAVEQDLVTDIFDIAAYADAELNPLRWLSLRGGVREEFFAYNVLNNCATNGQFVRNAPLNVNCPAFDGSGPREPSSRITASGAVLEPRGTLVVKARPDLSFTASYGVGAQSLDARFLQQDENTPVSQLRAGEVGILYRRRFSRVDLSARTLAYYTHVDRDLIFDPQQGRLTASDGTTREGFVGALRATSGWFDEVASVTYAHASFDRDGAWVPYVPIWIARSSSAVFGPLPRLRLMDSPLIGTAGVSINYLGQRALPYGQFSAPTVRLDASASLAWKLLTLGVRAENLLDAQYAASQFFYASDFHSRDYPTLVPTGHFTAASPRAIFFTVSLSFDRGTPP